MPSASPAAVPVDVAEVAVDIADTVATVHQGCLKLKCPVVLSVGSAVVACCWTDVAEVEAAVD